MLLLQHEYKSKGGVETTSTGMMRVLVRKGSEAQGHGAILVPVVVKVEGKFKGKAPVLGKLKVQVLGPHPHPHIGHAERGGRKNGDVHTVKLPPGAELPVQYWY